MKFGVREFGCVALGKKYNCSPMTICNIVHETD